MAGPAVDDCQTGFGFFAPKRVASALNSTQLGLEMLNIAPQPFPSFGQRIRHLRRAHGLKQLVIAQGTGVDQATVSRWESGLQVPQIEIQHAVFNLLAHYRTDDRTLLRLIENSNEPVHLVDDISHICLAYSNQRAKDWQTSQTAMVGVSLWQFATDEIRAAEAELADTDWWSARIPTPKVFRTSEAKHDAIIISAGAILWERLYLADGTPVRLVSAT